MMRRGRLLGRLVPAPDEQDRAPDARERREEQRVLVQACFLASNDFGLMTSG
jgi:hypothetical protein